LATNLQKRSFSLARHRTSVALEPAFWTALEHVAAARGVSVVTLVTQVDATRAAGSPLASELRLTILGSMILRV